MVQLHGFEHDDDPRPTTDIDMLGRAGRPPRMTETMAKRRDLKFQSDRQDLIRLFGYVEDPRSLAEADGLTAKERGWLRDVEDALAFDDPALLQLFSGETLLRARHAFGLLARLAER
jgi:hypothetical protein